MTGHGCDARTLCEAAAIWCFSESGCADGPPGQKPWLVRGCILGWKSDKPVAEPNSHHYRDDKVMSRMHSSSILRWVIITNISITTSTIQYYCTNAIFIASQNMVHTQTVQCNFPKKSKINAQITSKTCIYLKGVGWKSNFLFYLQTLPWPYFKMGQALKVIFKVIRNKQLKLNVICLSISSWYSESVNRWSCFTSYPLKKKKPPFRASHSIKTAAHWSIQ